MFPASILLQVEEERGSAGKGSPSSSSTTSAAPHLTAKGEDRNLLARALLPREFIASLA